MFQRARYALADLFDWSRMRDRNFVVPTDADAAFLFSFGRQQGRRNLSGYRLAPRCTSRTSDSVRMLLDVIGHGIAIVYCRSVNPRTMSPGCKPAAAAGESVQLCRSSAFRPEESEVAYTLSSPTARLRLVRFHPYGVHVAVAFKFHRNGFTFAPDYRSSSRCRSFRESVSPVGHRLRESCRRVADRLSTPESPDMM